MKSKSRTVFLVFGLILVFGIVFGIYFFIFYNPNKDEIKFNSPSELVESYIKALMNEDYVRAYKHINLPYNSAINKDDYRKYITSKKEYKEINKYNIIKDVEEDEALFFMVTLSDKSNNTVKIEVNLVERTVNDYRIDESDLYVENFKLTVPKNTKVTIDKFQLNSEILIRNGEYDDVYLLPAIAKNKKFVVLENRLGKKEVVLNINDDSKEEKILIEFENDELKNKAYSFIRDSWNDMYNNYYSGIDIAAVKKYFDESFSEEKMKNYYYNGFGRITAGNSSISEYSGYQIVDIIDNVSEKNFVSTDDIITVNFGYELSWYWVNKNAGIKLEQYHMTRYSSIRLKIIGDSFVIYDVVDPGLFTYSSQFTRDY